MQELKTVVTFAPEGVIQFDNARIVYRNFEGRGSMYNHEGDRNFAVVIPNKETADRLAGEGWNVKVKEGDDPDNPFIILPVKVKYSDRGGPFIYLTTDGQQTPLDEANVGVLDEVDIEYVNLDIRPYDWKINGKDGVKTGRAAYLQGMEVFQHIGERYRNRFAPVEETE